MADATQWEPTENQKAALAYAQDHDYMFSVSTLCQEIGIARPSYYDWFQHVPFADWWLGNWSKHFALHLPTIYATMMNKASGATQKGDVAAAKLMAERFDKGYVPHTRQDVAGVPGAPLKTYICVDPAEVTGIPDKGEEKGDEG